MKNIFISLFLLLVLLAKPVFALSVEEGPFVDVFKNHEYIDALIYAKKNQIITGYEDGSYRPDLQISRAEFVKLVIAANFGNDVSGGECFSDVANEWFAPYVCFAKRNGIVSGKTQTIFAPNDNLQFAEAAKILLLANGDEFDEDLEIWYRPYVQHLSEIAAIPVTILRFDQYLTRSEAVEILYRINANITNSESASYEELGFGESFKKEF